jgi:ATP-dependent Lhr-like helicase
LALLLAHREARDFFKDLRRVVLDELHSLVVSKRGDLLSLGLARLFAMAPQAMAVGLSATVREPDELRRYLVPQRGAISPMPQEGGEGNLADLVVVQGGAAPDIRMLELDERLPLAGHTASLSMPAIYDLIRRHKTTLVFVNTRLQAEYTFQELWNINDDGLPIALHHGSLDVSQRRRVEEAMGEGRLKAVVCTATLDLGIDWGDVDLVVNVGAPKGASRIMQRIGRANHRMDEPSKAYLVPANRFEILECRAALDAVHEAAQDTPDARIGALDVLCQHILGMACADPFAMEDLYEEMRSAAPYAGLTWEEFEACVAFVATGGYALRAYERFAKIVKGQDGLWRVRDAKVAQQYRMNVGTIIEATMIKVRLGKTSRARPGSVLPRGRILGEIEEYFAETLTPGDTFLFAGEVLRFEGMAEDEVLVTRAGSGTDPMIPSYDGGKFPLSTFLASRVREILADPFEWDRLPPQMTEWLLQQRRRSVVPGPRDLLVETFPRANRFYMTCFPFEGRPAHQTLGMLLTRRLERAGLKPLGFVANDYGIAVYGSGDIAARAAWEPGFMDDLFSEDMLGDDLEAWLAESALMRRAFRQCAVIAGLIERRFPGQQKTGRQVTISTDLVYDVLRKHEPDHVLLRAARADAATGLLDVRRLAMMLQRIRGRIIHKPLDRVSPLSVSVMLEIGRERVYSDNADEILAEAEAALLDEALAS